MCWPYEMYLLCLCIVISHRVSVSVSIAPTKYFVAVVLHLPPLSFSLLKSNGIIWDHAAIELIFSVIFEPSFINSQGRNEMDKPRGKSLIRILWKSLWKLRNLARLSRKSLLKNEKSRTLTKCWSVLPLGINTFFERYH